MRSVLMHVSDLHAGRPFDPHVAEIVAREAHALQPDLLIVSGDLVQRADFAHEWRTIKAYLATLPEPRLIIPGNHDVPLFNPFERFFRPLRTYQRQISTELNPVFERPGLLVAGANTAHGFTIDGGRLAAQQWQVLERIMSNAPAEACKVVVVHHHVFDPPQYRRRSKIRNAVATVRALDAWGVDLMVCGHIHRAYAGTTLDLLPDLRQGTAIAQSGTTTSRRTGRHGQNSYNVITIDTTTITVQPFRYEHGAAGFTPLEAVVFPRRSTGRPMRPIDPTQEPV